MVFFYELKKGLIALEHPRYTSYTLWLFTVNDIKTMVIPSTMFALFTTSGLQQLPIKVFIQRLPRVLAWTWINLLAFTVNNQRHWRSIREDALNKPWRPLPAGRVEHDTAKFYGPIAYSFAIVASFILGGGHIESCLLGILDHLYSDRHLGDTHWYTRNIINGFGATSFAAGALSVALQSRVPFEILPWLAILVATIATTIETMDLYDEEGDSAAGRDTIPLHIGDAPARWMVAAGVTCWSCVAPVFWRNYVAGLPLVWALGGWVAWRSLQKRSVKEDRRTFTIYNAWLATLYALPLITANNIAQCGRSFISKI